MDYKQQIQELLNDPSKLTTARPYTRQTQAGVSTDLEPKVKIGQKLFAPVPSLIYETVTVPQLLAELDPYSHKVLFDDNIPSISVKRSDGSFVEIEYSRMAIPFQRLILDKQVLHSCHHPMQFTLLNTKPTDRQRADFIKFKQGWEERNMDGHKTDSFRKAKSQGTAACLFYFDYKGQCKARTLSYEDGYQICPHRDSNGDIILVSIHYTQGDVEYIDSYDDSFMYRYSNDGGASSVDGVKDGQPYVVRNGWRWHQPMAHGFSEIPIAVKSCKVAWDRVQSAIEVYEVNVNIFSVCQKRFGWGILYLKGQFNSSAKKIAGAVVLNDTSGETANDAKFLTPPSPTNMIEYLKKMEGLIQLGSGTTFLLPEDIRISGDTSGLAIQLTQELDMETARNNIREWQNFASKMSRLFKEGYAKELVNTDPEYADAITRFASISIDAKFVVWRPQSDTDYCNMLTTLKGNGGISQQTYVEKNPASTPDEADRLSREREQAMAEQERLNRQSQQQADGNTQQA